MTLDHNDRNDLTPTKGTKRAHNHRNHLKLKENDRTQLRLQLSLKI